VAVAGLLVLFAVVGVRNATQYPPVAGTDAEHYLDYARGLVDHWDIPGSDQRGYYTPPGFFLLAGTAGKIAGSADMAVPDQGAQVMNVLFTVLTGALLAWLVALVLPGRRVVLVVAVAVFVTAPVVVRHASMYHPQPLAALLGLLAVVLTTRLLVKRTAMLRHAVAIGVAAGLAQLVRNVGLWSLGVAVVALVAAAAVRPEARRRLLAGAAIVAVVGVSIPLPWYVHLQRAYGDPIFGRFTAGPLTVSVQHDRPDPGVRLLASRASLLLASSSQPARFWVSAGLPEVFTAPHRGTLAPGFLSILYTDVWGDYFGFWAWGSQQIELTSDVNRRLVVQSVAGLVPSALAVAGALALLGLVATRLRTRLALLPAALYPAVGVVAMAFYAARAPIADGDTVKSVFLLPVVPAFCLAAGLAVDVVLRRHRLAGFLVLVALAASLGLSLEFGVL